MCQRLRAIGDERVDSGALVKIFIGPLDPTGVGESIDCSLKDNFPHRCRVLSLVFRVSRLVCLLDKRIALIRCARSAGV